MKNTITVGRNLLETLTSALYENPIILFREYVQNSLDAYNDATKQKNKKKLPNFKVEITIDKINRKITIIDNGYGIESKEKFVENMLSFGNSEKDSNRSQFIGFRGIGRMSALPFCDTLIFENKAENATEINFCTWQGQTYKELLNSGETNITTFEQTVREIVKIKHVSCDVNKAHYFKVEIINYGLEIDELLEQVNFEESLTRSLPIKYKDSFVAGQKIENKYREFMNENLSDYMCPVMLNGVELRKCYTDNMHVLESDILFCEIREMSNKPHVLGDKIGILWFTFNRKMTASKAKDSNYGILVRSKNVLMGNNDIFATLCTNSKKYVATYSELTATLRGVYGELLIDSPKLKDNARRDWFKMDENSVYLKNVIVDFMERLYKYRYAASKYFRQNTDVKEEKRKAEFKTALIELVDIENNKIDVGEFTRSEIRTAKANEKDGISLKCSDEDIPRESHTKRKIYDELMDIIKSFFEKEKKYDVFLKLRAYIKKHFDS